jgi:hypothetical protein
LPAGLQPPDINETASARALALAPKDPLDLCITILLGADIGLEASDAARSTNPSRELSDDPAWASGSKPGLIT